MTRRPVRALLATTAVAAMLLTAALPASARVSSGDESVVTPVERYQSSRTAAPATPGANDASFRNMAHVWNYNPGGDIGTTRGTDIEFYSPSVARRDYRTGELILDEGGNRIVEQRDFAVIGTYSRGAYIFDITNPEQPEFVRSIPCNQTQNDVQIRQFGERWILALAKDGTGNPCVTSPQLGTSGQAGIAVFDISDPYDFQRMYSFRTTGGAHNFTFHPTKPYGYVSTGDLPGGVNHVPIIDFTDVEKPKLAADPQIEGGPHDISFNSDGSRAYIASENNMQIWDTTNPAAPRLISRMVGPASYVHGADPTPDGKHVVLTDESLVLGGFFTARKAVCPGGGITLYNVEGANEAAPKPVGFAVANATTTDTRSGACTAHVGRITPNSKFYITGWYRAGVRVFDISNPSVPSEVGHAMMDTEDAAWSGEVWAAKPYKGNYIYSADMRRGFDVYRWTGPDLGMPKPAGADDADASLLARLPR